MGTDFRGWIKPGEYETEVIDGHEYVYIWSQWQRILLRIVKGSQWSLWKLGIAIHDPVFGECTPDGNCCGKGGRKRFIHWPLRIREQTR